MGKSIGPVEVAPTMLVFPTRVSASPSLETILEEEDETRSF
ncbi:PREDICTED: uncharacterized protein LOC109117259 [Tarenaya hassleriana]|nr:PREDICTED: uncharacterized protein LOC109117259 [Tarenaya hassleriana]